jgi:hypothetical protein
VFSYYCTIAIKVYGFEVGEPALVHTISKVVVVTFDIVPEFQAFNEVYA